MRKGTLIYDHVVLDMETWKMLDARTHVHHGDVDMCKGGGSSTTVTQNQVDHEYNMRLAAIQERAQDLSDQYFKFWKENNAVLESQQIKYELENLPQEQRITQGVLGLQENSLGVTGELTDKFLNASLKGVNGEEWADRAGTDQQAAASNANAQLARNASRMGLNMNSGAFQNALADQATRNAAAVGAARTQAFRAADEENYKRLATGASAGLGLVGK